jgi:hypothetical protein
MDDIDVVRARRARRVVGVVGVVDAVGAVGVILSEAKEPKRRPASFAALRMTTGPCA